MIAVAFSEPELRRLRDLLGRHASRTIPRLADAIANATGTQPAVTRNRQEQARRRAWAHETRTIWLRQLRRASPRWRRELQQQLDPGYIVHDTTSSWHFERVPLHPRGTLAAVSAALAMFHARSRLAPRPGQHGADRVQLAYWVGWALGALQVPRACHARVYFVCVHRLDGEAIQRFTNDRQRRALARGYGEGLEHRRAKSPAWQAWQRNSIKKSGHGNT